MKSFINLEDGSNLTDISPITTCIQTINASELLWDDDRSKYFKSLSLKQLKCDTEGDEGGFCFAVSLRDGSCLYASSTITKYLGYPSDTLVGQCMVNFLLHEDHLTFSNHLTQGLNACLNQGKKDISHFELNTFFCRLRVFASLKSVADQKMEYKPFRINLHIRELIVEDLCMEKPSGTLCVKATALQIEPAYTIPEEIPAMSSFSTKHTASCHFSHVDGSAIPYLGYLPQDMIGYSVFDFYHIDDLVQLKDIYALVVKERGMSFCTKPYRFKVQNGEYVMLETEWSCFINPWTRKLEFVVGQHRILKGPTNIDIFAPTLIDEEPLPDEIQKESQTIQNEIKDILSQLMPNSENSRKRGCNKRKRDLASFDYSGIDGNSLQDKANKRTAGDEQDAANNARQDGDSDPDSVVMGDISPYREANDTSISSETPPTVQQLRYQENIERFFASEPKTYSIGSDESNKQDNKSTSVDDSLTSSIGYGNDSVNAPGNSTTNDPQCSKSFQKAQENRSNSSNNLSRDSGCGQSFETNANNDPCTSKASSYAQTWTKRSKDCITNKAETFSSCLALTEESLSVHNRIGHKHLKQFQRKNKATAAVPNKDTSWFQHKDSPQKHKMSSQAHNATATTTFQTNALRGCTTHEVPSTYCHRNAPCHAPNVSSFPNVTHAPCAHASCASAPPPTPFFIPVMYMGSMPCYPSFPSTYPWPQMQPQSAEHPNNNVLFPGIPPFYPANGFLPQQMPSLYSVLSTRPNAGSSTIVPSSGLTSTLPLTTTATTIASGASPIIKNSITRPTSAIVDRRAFASFEKPSPCFKDVHMRGDGSQTSSFSSSLQSADKEEDMDIGVKTWCGSSSDKIELSTEIAYRYRLSTPDILDVLKKDREMLKSMQQPELVNKQLRVLQKEMKDDSEVAPRKNERDLCLTEDVMLGLTTDDQVNEGITNCAADTSRLVTDSA